MSSPNTKLTFTTYGVGTPRYRSYVLLSSDELLLSLGPNLILWDLKTQSSRFLAVTQSVIMVILPLELEKGLVVTISYNGEITIVDLKQWQVIKEFRTQGSGIREASLFNGKLLVFAETFKELKGLTEVFDVWSGVCIKSLPGRLRFGEILDDQTIFVLRKNPLTCEEKEKVLGKDKDIELKTSSKGNKTKKKLFNYYMELYDISEKGTNLPIRSEHLPEVNEIIAMAFNINRDIIAFLYSNRKILLINPWKLTVLFSTKIAGAGAIMSLNFSSAHPEELILCPKQDTLLKLDCAHLSKAKGPDVLILEEIKPNSGFSLENYKGSEAFSVGNYLGFHSYDSNKNRLAYITFNMDGLHFYNYQTNKTTSLQISNITHCGVALNPEETLMATGDFLGNVYIFSTTYLGSEPIYIFNFNAGIRSLAWGLSSPPYLLVGCMDGNIYKWNYTDLASMPEILQPGIHGSITCMNILNVENNELLLTSSTEGMLGVYIMEPKSNTFNKIHSFTAHEPQSDHHDKESFGSLEKYAEVWSNCWNPKSSLKSFMFATCSEDQTCKIWEMGQTKPTELGILKGHTKAITCVDWQETAIGFTFATCSDDRSIRIYEWKEGKMELVEVVVIDFVKEWFTLTYMALEKGGRRVACAAQNGFLFVYDMKNRKFEFSERIHLGSIEGLKWGEKGKLVTCSADLTIQVTDILKT